MSGIVRAPRLNPILGWSLAAAAVVGGYFSYGWQGVVLAMSAVVFWLLLQFSRVLRALRTAKPRARLRMVEYRGTVGAAMVYDDIAVIDHFRRLDENTVLGAMDQRGSEQTFFFLLERD